jgi:CBS-domain-containing membrane protein
VGLGSAFVGVVLFGIAYAPSIFEVKHLSWERVGASVLAVALAAALELLLRASHPPAVSTTLLASLGSFHPTVRDTVSVAVGVLIVAVVGELFRRLRAGRTSSPP